MLSLALHYITIYSTKTSSINKCYRVFVNLISLSSLAYSAILRSCSCLPTANCFFNLMHSCFSARMLFAYNEEDKKFEGELSQVHENNLIKHGQSVLKLSKLINQLICLKPASFIQFRGQKVYSCLLTFN